MRHNGAMAPTTSSQSQSLRRSAGVVLNGDIAGFSRLVAEDVERTVEAVRTAREVTAEAVVAAAGSLTDFVGDNFMAVFSSASAAVRAAKDIRMRVEALQSETPAPRRLRFRMGIAVGELISDGGSLYGEAINLAARIREAVGPGEIALSGSAFIRLDEPDEGVESLGPIRFKNLPEEATVYRLTDADSRPSVPVRRAMRPRILFGEVVSNTDDPRLDRVCRMVTHEIRRHLIGMPSMDVVGQIAPGDPALGYVFEAWADLSGDRASVYVELIEVERWVPRWSERFDLAVDDAARHAEQVGDAVAAAIEIETVFGEFATGYRSSLSAASLTRFHRAWDRIALGTADSLYEARELLERIGREEASLPEGPSMAAFASMLLVASGLSRDTAADMRSAMELCDEAGRRGDRTGLSDMVRAQVHLWQGELTDPAGVAAALEHARPRCDATIAVRANILRYMGRWEEAAELARCAIDLAPLAPPWYIVVLASAWFVGDRHDLVVEALEPLVDAERADLEALLLLAASQAALGMERSAAATMGMVRSSWTDDEVDRVMSARRFLDGSITERWATLVGTID